MKFKSAVPSLLSVSLMVAACTSQPKPEIKPTPPVQPVAKTDAEINVTQLATQAKLVPFPNEKKREGILVEGIEPGSDWAKIGLEKGDVITRVGDKSLASAEHGTDLMRAVANPGTERLEVMRKKGKHRERLYLPLDPK